MHVEIRDLGKNFDAPDGGVATVVAGFDLDLRQGEFLSLLGRSGCGKSTVLAMLAGLTAPSFGRMRLDGKLITGPGLDRGVVFQAPCLFPWLSVIENVLLGLQEALPDAGDDEHQRRALAALSSVAMEDSIDRKPTELSAGMCQRVSLARAYALAPKLLLLDEPFGMLDSITRVEMQLLVAELCRRDIRTTLMVSHDVDEALFLSDRIALMTPGPSARVGQIVEVPFARPREREQVLRHPRYRPLRDQLLGFLEQE